MFGISDLHLLSGFLIIQFLITFTVYKADLVQQSCVKCYPEPNYNHFHFQISKSNVVDDMVESNAILYRPGEKPDHTVSY